MDGSWDGRESRSRGAPLAGPPRGMGRPPSRTGAGVNAALCGVFFLSGAAALVFETLWFHQTGLALGNSVWASSLVLAAFMGGLATGNALAAALGPRVRRLLVAYAGLEVVIAVTGVGLVAGLPVLTPVLAPLLGPLNDDAWVLNAVRTGTAFALMLVPSAAMGATLPLLTRALFLDDPRFGSVLGRLYGWNTLGAVAGALLGDALWIGWWGIQGSAFAAAGMNALAAAVAIGVTRRRRVVPGIAAEPPCGPAPGRTPARALRILASTFLAGAALLALEVVWFRFLLLSVSGTSLAFAVMLATVLAGIGMGGLVGARWLGRRPEAFRQAPVAALLGGIACVASYAFFDALPRSFGSRSALTAWETLEVAAPLLLPTAFASGVLFTLLGEALHREIGSPARSAGLLTLSNTLGAMLGSLLGGFVLLPGIGIEASIASLAASYGLTAGLALDGWPRTRIGIATATATTLAFGAGIAAFPHGALEERHLARAARRFVGWETVLVREALTETLTYLRRDLFGEPYAWRLLTNGHSMSSTTRRDQRYMTLFVSWPAAFHPKLESALLISYGIGVTASALVEIPSLETIHVVDISQDILETNRIVYPEPGRYPLDDPRVAVHVEDGRHFLQTASQRFDLITGEPPPPKLAGIVNLYTREYFGLVRERLEEGGIASYWLPTKGLFPEDALAIVAAFCDAFPDCSLWSGAGWDWMLVGSRTGIEPASPDRLARLWDDPRVAARLHDIGVETPAQLGALFLADADQLRAWTRDVAPLEDDHPKRLRNEIPSPQPFFRAFMDPDAVGSRFRDSDELARLLPGALQPAARDALPAQALLEAAVFQELGEGPALLELLHPVLTGSPFETLVQWMLRSDAGAIRAAARAHAEGRESGASHWHRAVHALSERRYADAAGGFEQARQLASRTDRNLLYYEIYARFLAGQDGAARELADKIGIGRSDRPEDRAFDAFLARHFGWPD